MTINTKYILASASPRRKELFSKISSDFSIIPSNAEEKLSNELLAEEQSEYLAKIKALDIAEKYPNNIIIGADTSVVIDNLILGKPKDENEAKQMLELMSGRTHKVITGCAIVKNGVCLSFSDTTLVKFKTLTTAQIDEYVSSDEPYDKAGSYAIQGKAGAFIESIDGDFDNVVGLPTEKLKQKLNEVE